MPNQSEFVYPGPIPQSAETAVVMLADGVEAIARTLVDPTPERMRDVIDRIVQQRLDQGQLREAPLTLRQLSIVKREFARVLGGMYHARVEYPKAVGSIRAGDGMTLAVDVATEGVRIPVSRARVAALARGRAARASACATRCCRSRS